MKTDAKDWTRASLLEVLKMDSREARLDRLRRMGVLDAQNRLTPRANSWGDEYISHTLVEDEAPEDPAEGQNESQKVVG
jgi:hypothetical protein